MNKNLKISGCGTALVTPFVDGEVDYAAFRKLVARQLSGGVDFFLPLVTTGETPCLTPDERVEVLRICREEAGGKPVVVGGGTNSLKDTLSSIEFFAKYEPDAYLIVVPYYNKPTQEGQYQYFKAVASSTDKPIILYNVPGRTGANMLPETCLRLAAECPNITGIKEASGNYMQASLILKDAPEGFSVLSGDDDLTFAMMATGAAGVVSVASNIAPKEVSTMVHLCQEGDFIQARKLHHRLTPLFKACFAETSPAPAKAALAALGLCRNELRLPLVPASAVVEKQILEVVRELGINC